MAFKKICLAISLPVIAFISIYWFRQRKKIQNLSKEPTTNKDSIQNQQSTETDLNKIDKSTVESNNKLIGKITIDKPTNESSKIVQNNLINCKNLSIVSSNSNDLTKESTLDHSSTDEINSNSLDELILNNNDVKFQLKSADQSNSVKKQIDDSNNSAGNLTELNLNFKTLNDPILNKESNNVDMNASNNLNAESTKLDEENTKLERDHLEILNKELQSNNDLFEKEDEIFEVDNTNNLKLNNEIIQLTANATSLTFDTACDSSIDATMNSALDTENFSTKTLCSLNNSYLDESFKEINLDASEEREVKKFDNEEVKEDYLNKSKQDILEEDKNKVMNKPTKNEQNSMSITTAKVNDINKNGEMNFKLNEQAQNASFSTNSTLESTAQDMVVIDYILENNNEKFLNVTEAEFKNDSKIGNEILEEIKNRIELEEVDSEKKENSTHKNDDDQIWKPENVNLNSSIKPEEDKKDLNLGDKNDEKLDQSDMNDSILLLCEINKSNKQATNENDTKEISSESTQLLNKSEALSSELISTSSNQLIVLSNEQNEKSSSTNLKSASPNKSRSQNPKVNLDDSDVEFLFETCSNIKSKQSNNLNSPQQNYNIKRSFSRSPNQRQILRENGSLNSPDSSIKKNLIEHIFEIPQPICGLLIGKQHCFVNNLMHSTNTVIKIKNHPFIHNMNLCVIQAENQDEIDDALRRIRQRFPISKFPQVTLDHIENRSLIDVEPILPNVQLSLPDGVSCEVWLSDFLTPNHLFLQQPTHPTFNLLQRLDEYLISTYQFNDTPRLDNPVLGVICVVKKGDGWYRAMVVNIIDQDNCTVRLLDYGGFLNMPNSSLRQVKRDCMSIPFQAVECVLSNIQPANGVWSNESINFFREIACKHMLQSYIVGYTEHGIPSIYLYRFVDNKQPSLINKELCNNGFAIWLD